MDANLRLVPVTVLYFNKRCEMGEKHLAVYSVRFLPGEISRINRRGKYVRK
jgi:hypothetical protein